MEQLRVDAAARLDELRERVNEVLDELDIDPDQFDLPEIPALPESELDGDQPEPLLDSRWKEACYAPNKITNHHFTLGGGWRGVCGIRNDRRTHRRRPAGRHSLRARSSSNRRSMQRPR